MDLLSSRGATHNGEKLTYIQNIVYIINLSFITLGRKIRNSVTTWKFYQMWDKTKALTIDHGVSCPFKSRCILSV